MVQKTLTSSYNPYIVELLILPFLMMMIMRQNISDPVEKKMEYYYDTSESINDVYRIRDRRDKNVKGRRTKKEFAPKKCAFAWYQIMCSGCCKARSENQKLLTLALKKLQYETDPARAI